MESQTKAIIVCPDINNITTDAQEAYAEDYTYQYIRSHYNIDTTKIVVSGHSWGGRIAYDIGLGFHHPTSVNGVIGLAPALGSGNMDDTMWSNIKKIRMSTILGSNDFNYSAVEPLMKQMQSEGAQLLYIEKPGMDHVGNPGGYFFTQAFVDDFMKCYNFVLGITAGVPESSKISDAGYTIYPNPTTDFINVESKNGSIEKAEVYSQIGNRMLAVTTDSKIDVRNLESGMYFLRIGDHTFKFIKQ